jgi:hypothetical protein
MANDEIVRGVVAYKVHNTDPSQGRLCLICAYAKEGWATVLEAPSSVLICKECGHAITQDEQQRLNQYLLGVDSGARFTDLTVEGIEVWMRTTANFGESLRLQTLFERITELETTVHLTEFANQRLAEENQELIKENKTLKTDLLASTDENNESSRYMIPFYEQRIRAFQMHLQRAQEKLQVTKSLLEQLQEQFEGTNPEDGR